jgi:hypothetical protein
MRQPQTIQASKALEALVDLIRKGQCVLFLGAGINIGSTNPTFHYPEQHRPLQAGALGKKLVSGTDYKKKLPKVPEEDLAKAALFFEITYSRHYLVACLKETSGEGKAAIARAPDPGKYAILYFHYDELRQSAGRSLSRRP